MPLTFAETPLYYKDAQGNYHRVLSGADMTGYRTASAQDAIDAAQDADIASRAKTDEIGIVITGARPAAAVSPGQYVIVRGSTITGITDGLYINSSGGDLSPSADVTAADLTAVSSGGLNDLLSTIEITNSVTFSENVSGTNTHIYVNKNVLYVYYQGESKTHASGDVLFTLPERYWPQAMTYHTFVINNTGYGDLSLQVTGVCAINQVAAGATAGRVYASFSVPLP